MTASVGVDALMHALEAYTVVPYDARPALPLAERPPYQGANPFSDPLCERAIELVGRTCAPRSRDGDDLEARTRHGAAATLAGMAFSERRRAHPARARVSDRVAQARRGSRRATAARRSSRTASRSR